MNTVLRGRDGLEVVVSREGAFTPIGERLNPTNKPRLQRAYDTGNWAFVQRDAKRQVRAGARVIDVNTGDPHHDIEEAQDARRGAGGAGGGGRSGERGQLHGGRAAGRAWKWRRGGQS